MNVGFIDSDPVKVLDEQTVWKKRKTLDFSFLVFSLQISTLALWYDSQEVKRSRLQDITTDPISLATSLCLLDDDLSQPLVKINFLFKTENVWELKATSNTEYKSVVNYLKP